jgi:hypothetical protein
VHTDGVCEHRGRAFSNRNEPLCTDQKVQEFRRLCGRISLTRGLYASQNPNAQKNDSAHDNPARGQMHQVSAIDKAADHDSETEGIESE